MVMSYLRSAGIDSVRRGLAPSVYPTHHRLGQRDRTEQCFRTRLGHSTLSSALTGSAVPLRWTLLTSGSLDVPLALDDRHSSLLRPATSQAACQRRARLRRAGQLT